MSDAINKKAVDKIRGLIVKGLDDNNEELYYFEIIQNLVTDNIRARKRNTNTLGEINHILTHPEELEN